MEPSNLLIILAAEISTLLVLFCLCLLFKNRALRKLVNKLQERLEQLVQDLKEARSQKKTDDGATSKHYKKYIEEQLKLSRKRHISLNASQDIVLDIDPATPLPLRVAALRHAILTIELEASAANKKNTPNWDIFNQKYEQLLNFQEEYSADSDLAESNSDEVEALTDELKAAKKRINNLEKFKSLYLDLEEKWQSCKDNAQTHYDELSGMITKVEDSEQFEHSLNAYHNAYSDVSSLIENGVSLESEQSNFDGDSAGEIRHLRAVAADQHRIINELQHKLENANTDQEKSEVVESLQTQLEKQIRFVQESETCIQLMEDELSNAHKELEQMKSRLATIPQIKTELKELRENKESNEMQVYTLRATNQRLTKELKAAKKQSGGSTGTSDDSQQLKKQLTEMEAKYADLEEKFLDLKINS